MARFITTVLVLAIAAVATCESHHKVEKMFMSRTMGSDLFPSATGYIFRSDSNGPASYVQLGAGAVHKHLNTYPNTGAQQANPAPYSQGLGAYGSAAVKPQAPAQQAGKYYTAPVASSYNGYSPASNIAANIGSLPKNSYGQVLQQAAAPKKASAESDENDESGDEESDGSKFSSESNDDDSGDASFAGYAGNFDYSGDSFGKSAEHPNYAAEFDADAGYGSAGFGSSGAGKSSDDGSYAADSGYANAGHGGHHHGSAFKHGGGKSYGTDGHSAHGEKGDKGYKSASHFDKAEQGKHFKDGHKGYYGDVSGHKSGHSDTADHYGQKHEAAKGYKGGSYGAKKGHAKGSKTTGFHNVYHKDEFKKDHDFYDDAHKSGKFNKHSGFGANHHSSHGGHKKGGHHDSAHHQDNFGKSGHSHKGQAYDHDQGHADKAGHEGHFNKYSDFGKKGGHSDGSEYGFAQKH